MTLDEVRKRITLPELFKSYAFATADDKWRFESWDDKQWDRIINLAISEKINGPVRKRRAPTRHT